MEDIVKMTRSDAKHIPEEVENTTSSENRILWLPGRGSCPAMLSGKIEMADFFKPYIAKSGTSMATPIVSGAAALVLQKYPRMSNEEFLRRVALTATDLGEPWNKQGFGMLNVRRLLENK